MKEKTSMKSRIKLTIVLLLLALSACAGSSRVYTVETPTGTYTHTSPSHCKRVVEDTSFGGTDLTYIQCSDDGKTIDYYNVTRFTVSDGEE